MRLHRRWPRTPATLKTAKRWVRQWPVAHHKQGRCLPLRARRSGERPAGRFFTMDENGHGMATGVRGRLELGRVSEVELVTHGVGAGGAWNHAGYARLEAMRAPKPLWTAAPRRAAPVAPGAGASRQLLLRRDREKDGKGFYPFTDDCDRLENGAETTNNRGWGAEGPAHWRRFADRTVIPDRRWSTHQCARKGPTRTGTPRRA